MLKNGLLKNGFLRNILKFVSKLYTQEGTITILKKLFLLFFTYVIGATAIIIICGCVCKWFFQENANNVLYNLLIGFVGSFIASLFYSIYDKIIDNKKAISRVKKYVYTFVANFEKMDYSGINYIVMNIYNERNDILSPVIVDKITRAMALTAELKNKNGCEEKKNNEIKKYIQEINNYIDML